MGSNSLEIVISCLDQMRCYFISVVSRLELFRAIYPSRQRRIFVLTLVAFILAAMGSLLFPVFLSSFGTLFLGPLHILAHMRFFPQMLASQNSNASSSFLKNYPQFFTFASIGLGSFILCSKGLTLAGYSMQLVIILSVIAVIAGQLLFFTLFKGLRNAFSSVSHLFVVLILVGIVVFAPLFVQLIFVLDHNFIALFYWVSAARGKCTKALVLLPCVLLVLLAIVVLLIPVETFPLFGILDQNLLSNDVLMAFAPLGASVLNPELQNLWTRLFVLFVFSQSIHYFLWLRAIPDALARQGVPRSFRATVRSFRETTGLWPVAAVILGLSFFLIFAAFDLSQARYIYLSFAFMHGLSELIGLGMLRSEENQHVV
jgi:hypothetical protein